MAVKGKQKPSSTRNLVSDNHKDHTAFLCWGEELHIIADTLGGSLWCQQQLQPVCHSVDIEVQIQFTMDMIYHSS